MNLTSKNEKISPALYQFNINTKFKIPDGHQAGLIRYWYT